MNFERKFHLTNSRKVQQWHFWMVVNKLYLYEITNIWHFEHIKCFGSMSNTLYMYSYILVARSSRSELFASSIQRGEIKLVVRTQTSLLVKWCGHASDFQSEFILALKYYWTKNVIIQNKNFIILCNFEN